MNTSPDTDPMFTKSQTAISSDAEPADLLARVAELERECVELKWTNEAINALASGTGGVTGQAFLQTLVRQLSRTLKVGYVFVTEWVPGRTDRLRTVAGWCRDHASDAIEYDMFGAPCRKVLEDGDAFFPHGTRQLFPDDEYLAMHNIESYMGASLFTRTGRPAGHLCIMDERPFLFDYTQGRAIVKVFAERAGAELERLRAEEVLRQREERFRALYDDNPSMYFTLSPDGTIVSVNRYGAGQLGYTTDELVGRSVLMVFDAVDQQTVLAQLKQCTGNPFQTFTWEIQKTRKDGTRLWVHERARAIINSDGALTILIVCEDVTERRRTSQLLSTLIHESPLPIVSLDRKARVTSWNQAATRLFGWSEDEVLGRELPYVRPGDETASDILWEAGTRGEVAGPIELRRQRKDGAPLDLLLWPVFVQEKPGEVSTAVGIYVDQSNLIQAESARRESERRLRTIIDSEPECVKTVSPDGLLMSINPAGLAMIGAASEKDLLGRPVFPLIHPLDRPAYERFHQTVCGGETAILAFRIVDYHGKERYLEAHSVPLRNDNGAIAGVLSITRDVTARKQSEMLLAGEMRCLELIAKDTPLTTVLETLCTMIEHQNPELLCSILLLDHHTRRLHPCAAPSLPPAYVRAFDGLPIGPAVGSCGTAAFHAKPAIVPDIAQDPRWAAHRSLALGHGLKACWSMPILSPSQQVLGTFAIYSRRPCQPTPTDLSLLERATHLAGIAIVKTQASGEREQISRDLHDNILQSLYAVGMQMEAAKLTRAKSPRKCKTHIAQAIDQLNHLVLDVRQFIALLTQRSAVKSNFGDALRQLTVSMCAADQVSPEFEINNGVLSKITPFQGQQLLNIVREALSNSRRHAQATRRWVKLSHTTDAICLVIGDNGIGFAAGRPLRRGHGLANMAARAKKLHARFSLESAPGLGTCITVEIPIEEGSTHGEIHNDSVGDRRRPRSRAYRAQRGAESDTRHKGGGANVSNERGEEALPSSSTGSRAARYPSP